MHIHPETHSGQPQEKHLLNVVDDLCHFIMHEMVNVRGKFFHEAQELAMENKYIGLREWHNQVHRAASSSIPREYGINMYSICTLMIYSNDILFLYNLILYA